MKPEAQRPARIPALDGLRGIAALIVLIHHSLLTLPSFARAYAQQRPWQRHDGSWWMTYTPLHLAWAGTEAVYCFFLLSGLVLALPAARGRHHDWTSYYPKRIGRLYLPVLGATLLALAWIALIPRVYGESSSWWLAGHSAHPRWRATAHDLVLVFHRVRPTASCGR